MAEEIYKVGENAPAEGLFFGKEPRVDAERIAVLPKGQTVKKLEESATAPGWWKVSTDVGGVSVEGFVQGEFLTAVAEETPVQPPAEVSKMDKFFPNNWTGYLIIGAALGLILLITVLLSHRFSVSRAEELTQQFKLADKTVACESIAAAQNKVAIINAQRKEIVGFATSHHSAAIEFFANFYSTYAVFALFGLLAAIALAVITKDGVAKADNRVIAVFMIATGIVVMYQGFFGVFKQTESADQNAALYIKYAQLVNQIDSYCTTGMISVKDPIQQIAAVDPTPTPTTTNTTAAGNGNTQSNASNSGQTKPEATPAPKKILTIEPFYVSMKADEFINYIDWHVRAYKSLPIIGIDAAQIKAIDNTRFAMP